MICSLRVRRGCFLGRMADAIPVWSSSRSRLILTFRLSVAARLMGGAWISSVMDLDNEAISSQYNHEVDNDRFQHTDGG